MNQLDCLGILDTFPGPSPLLGVIERRRVLKGGDLKLFVVDFEVEPGSAFQDN